MEQVFDPENYYKIFSENLISLFDSCFPEIIKNIKRKDHDKPYITPYIKSKIRERSRLRRQFDKWPITYGPAYKKLRNEVNHLIRKAENNYFHNKFKDCSGDSNQTWRSINDILGRERRNFKPIKLEVENNLITDPLEVAEKFNTFFSQVGYNLSRKFTQTNDDFIQYLSYSACSFKF